MYTSTYWKVFIRQEVGFKSLKMISNKAGFSKYTIKIHIVYYQKCLDNHFIIRQIFLELM